MRSDTFRDSAVPANYKILSALAIVVATKCEPCINGYTNMAHEAGTTVAELVEFLNVALTESGCPGEQRAMKSLQMFQDLEDGKHIDADICCKDTN
jgi:AhpD family alkylhydroperoxidase